MTGIMAILLSPEHFSPPLLVLPVVIYKQVQTNASFGHQVRFCDDHISSRMLLKWCNFHPNSTTSFSVLYYVCLEIQSASEMLVPFALLIEFR